MSRMCTITKLFVQKSMLFGFKNMAFKPTSVVALTTEILRGLSNNFFLLVKFQNNMCTVRKKRELKPVVSANMRSVAVPRH